MRLNTITKKLKTGEVLVSYSRGARAYCCTVPLLRVKSAKGRPNESFVAYGRTPDLAMKNFAKAISGKTLWGPRVGVALIGPEVTAFNKVARKKRTKSKLRFRTDLAYRPVYRKYLD